MYVCLCTQAQASTFGKEAKLQQPLKRNRHQKELTVSRVEPSSLLVQPTSSRQERGSVREGIQRSPMVQKFKSWLCTLLTR